MSYFIHDSCRARRNCDAKAIYLIISRNTPPRQMVQMKKIILEYERRRRYTIDGRKKARAERVPMTNSYLTRSDVHALRGIKVWNLYCLARKRGEEHIKVKKRNNMMTAEMGSFVRRTRDNRGGAKRQLSRLQKLGWKKTVI